MAGCREVNRRAANLGTRPRRRRAKPAPIPVPNGADRPVPLFATGGAQGARQRLEQLLPVGWEYQDADDGADAGTLTAAGSAGAKSINRLWLRSERTARRPETSRNRGQALYSGTLRIGPWWDPGRQRTGISARLATRPDGVRVSRDFSARTSGEGEITHLPLGERLDPGTRCAWRQYDASC